MKKQKTEKPVMVQQKHARILREALAKLANPRQSPPAICQYINQQLARYAESVKPYCECNERVFIAAENKEACLDCGQRHEPTKDYFNTEKATASSVKLVEDEKAES